MCHLRYDKNQSYFYHIPKLGSLERKERKTGVWEVRMCARRVEEALVQMVTSNGYPLGILFLSYVILDPLWYNRRVKWGDTK